MAARPIFVAPHYDDVALSCGGTVALAARRGSPLIVTVFGGLPAEELGDFARFQHERWGFGEGEAIARRRAEDACAAAALGDTVETRWLNFLDAIYRRAEYSSDPALFGEVLPADAGLAEEIAGELARLGVDEYFVPLAAGNHVDHQIVLAMGRLLASGGAPVWGYPDVPYVLSGRWQPPTGTDRRVVTLNEDALSRKIAAVSCYTSQVPVLFRDLGDPAEALRGYALQCGAGTPAEIFYSIAG